MRKSRATPQRAGDVPDSPPGDASAERPRPGVTAGDVVGGYRLVRLLGEGPRAVVFLATLADGTPSAIGEGVVALKLYRTTTSRASIDCEAEALGRQTHEHAVRLLDVATAPNGLPCLVLERLTARSLGVLISERGPLRAGEAVTVLAPLALALDAVHSSGVVHGDVGAASVLFRENGAPVLAGFGAATLTAQGRPSTALDADPRVSADRAGFLDLADLVLARVRGPDAVRLASSLRAIGASGGGFGVPVSDALFDFAPAEPLRLERSSSPGEHSIPARAIETSPVEVRPVEVDATRHPLAVHLRAVRARVWAPAGIVAVGLVAAFLGVPAPEQPPAAPKLSAAPGPAGTSPSVAPTDIPEPESPTGGAPDEKAVVGDDPVAATRVLIATRERCLRDLDVVCLDAVSQKDSPARRGDERLIREILDGGEVGADATIRTGSLALVQRLGDSAIVALGGPADSKPASTLVIKGEAGWRIRDYVSP